MKLIGKGAFTKAYLIENNKVRLISCDPIKECMSFGWFPKSRLFPKIERIDSDEFSTYEMDFYPRVTSLKKELKPKEYEKYMELRNLEISYTFNNHENRDQLYKAFKTIKNRTLKNVLIQALDACGNYGQDICFEISPRNVRVKNGNLILMDCFFIKSELTEIRTSKRDRR